LQLVCLNCHVPICSYFAYPIWVHEEARSRQAPSFLPGASSGKLQPQALAKFSGSSVLSQSCQHPHWIIRIDYPSSHHLHLHQILHSRSFRPIPRSAWMTVRCKRKNRGSRTNEIDSNTAPIISRPPLPLQCAMRYLAIMKRNRKEGRANVYIS
jgi:hypothetical protein